MGWERKTWSEKKNCISFKVHTMSEFHMCDMDIKNEHKWLENSVYVYDHMSRIALCVS